MPDRLLIPIRLAKEGFGGTPQEISRMRVDLVLAALEYSAFLSDYEETHAEINKDPKK